MWLDQYIWVFKNSLFSNKNTKTLNKVELPEHSDLSKKDNTLHKDKSWMRDDAISGNSASNASRGNVIKLLTSGRHPSPATE